MKNQITRFKFATMGVLLFAAIAPAADGQTDDEAAILSAMESYVETFNRGDAAAVADHWSDEGEWVSPTGMRIKGRENIQTEMAAYFAEGAGARIEISDPSIRFVAPTVAIEEGKAIVTRRGELPSETNYIAIHTKQAGVWKMDSVRETLIPTAPSNYEYLKELEWMIGSWVDRDENATVETSCQWTKNRNFMTRSFKVTAQDRIEMEGTQVVGWDAAEQRIRSWVFDSDGSFSHGQWTKDGDRWTVSAAQVFSDGTKGSSINIITWIDNDTFEFQSVGRQIAGKLMPNIDPIIVVRK